MILVFKGIGPKVSQLTLDTHASVHGRNTRNKNKLDIPTFNATTGQRSFEYRAVKFWNMLPEEITDCASLHSFKSKAKSHFFLHSFSVNLLYLLT